MDKLTSQIFKKGSKTFFYSSLFFPKDIKEDVFNLYAFVRTTDNFVDKNPPKIKEFKKFKMQYKKTTMGKMTGNQIIDNFIKLAKKKNSISNGSMLFSDLWKLI